MPNKKYSDFIEISPTFESVVDIDADQRNANLWREYIVGKDMETLMGKLCQSINKEEPDSRRSFWIEGNYGTGKSYAALLIKHVMEEKADVIDDFLSHSSRLAQFRNRVMKFRAKEKGDFLVIWKPGCIAHDGTSMLMEAERAIREALKENFGDKADYGDDSLQDSVLRAINNPAHNWEYILESTTLSDNYDNVEQLRQKIESGDLLALQRTAAVIRQYNWGLVDSLDTFKKWVTAIIQNNGLSKTGIFFIWDEFTEYVSSSDDQTILQQLSEFSKVQPLFMLFVVHRTNEMIERITPERYQLITHRFHQVMFRLNPDAAYDLIAGSISIRPNMEEYWKEERRPVLNNIRKYLPAMEGLDDKISEQIDLLCPMHPMTIKHLSRVANNYAAAQRTMFRFMKDQSTPNQGFVAYINQYGPESQACWLTPDWLWDYFFTRESDFSDKDTKAAEYIRHYEESRHLVEDDENAHRVFKTAMLLLALMSSTKGLYSGRRTKDGISATKDCLETCLAGVISKEQVDDLLDTMVDSKILVLDEDSQGIVRIQLPFRGTSQDGFSDRLASNEKKYSRYMMFSKDGAFAQAFEKQAWDENDATLKRMKIAVCCAETNSVNTRLGEITKELEKNPYKLGLLIVTVSNDAQANSIQSFLKDKSSEVACAMQGDLNASRLTIALVKQPLTDEIRKKWLTAITKQEMANEAGQTGAAGQYKIEAQTIISSWVGSAVSAGKIIAYNGNSIFNNLFGMAHLRKTIRISVQDTIFKFAPENVVVTNTAYRSCNEAAAMAGVLRKSNNNQMNSVLNALKQAGILDLSTIGEIADAGGSRAADCVAALAKLIRKEMESGHKVNLSDLWDTLQLPPFGYYNSVACGVLLGYVFSCYKNSRYTWTDSVQSTHILAEATIAKMVSTMCGGKMTTDYLSAGSVTWQNFSEYLGKIFNLTAAQLAEQTSGYHNVREVVTKTGTPFWTLKYLPANEWNNIDMQKKANEVIDGIQLFIAQEGDIDSVMSNVLQLMQGRGKIRVVLARAFQDKNTMAATFRSFLFEASPELKDIATKLSIQPEELSDKLHSVMQGAIYTWTEEQVKEKLVDVVAEYRFIEAMGRVLGTVYHSMEAARKDLSNQFKYLRIPMAAIEQLNKSWYPALEIFYRVSKPESVHASLDTLDKKVAIIENYGVYAKDALRDAKPILADILSVREIECTKEELNSIYTGLKDMTCDTTLSQFNKELDAQIGKINSARNKAILQETWHTMTGEDSVKSWCNTYGMPLMWIVPKNLQTAFSTLLDVQRKTHTVDSAVVSAINAFQAMDSSLLSDSQKLEDAFIEVIGPEYRQIWLDERDAIITEAKLKIGNDMSSWAVADLATIQGILKKHQQDKAKKEKLYDTKNTVRTMKESVLRERVAMFLDMHPEFCDDFSE